MAVSVEEFWNNSSTSAFNFDDDQEFEKLHSGLESLDTVNKTSVFITNLEDESKLSILPLHSVLTKRNLDAVLDDMHIRFSNDLPIQETILKMFLCQPYLLYSYQTLNQKLELLDEAILTEDGNIIITVLLYLRKSLKLSKLYHHLARRRIALQHYTNHLMKELNFEELANLYMYIRNFNDIVYLFYLECRDSSNKDRTLHKLTKFLGEYRHNLDSDKELLFLDFKKFTNWQMENKFACISVIEQLVELCEKELHYNNEKKIIEFKQFLKLNDFQYEWIMLNALCALQMWPKLISIFIKPNWLSKKNSFKSAINIELFLSSMYKHDPPKTLLTEFLGCISNGEEAVLLARRMNCYKFVVDFYVSQKDRHSIVNYKYYIPAHSEDYIYAENVLQAADRKWKN